MEYFLLSANIIIPIFLIVAVGFFLRKSHMIDEVYLAKTSKIVFTIAIPISMFLNISSADLSEVLDFKLIIFAVAGTLFMFFSVYFIVPLFTKNKQMQSAIVQGCYRGNYAIIGYPIVQRMFAVNDPTALSKSALIIAIVIPLYNILAVILFNIKSVDQHKKANVKQIYLGIIKNPLIIAAFVGIVFAILKINLPDMISDTLTLFNQLTTPLALIMIGASFTLAGAKSKITPAIITSVIKTVVAPLIMLVFAVILGFEGSDLGIIFVVFGAPASLTSYIMAKVMGSDDQLASSIVVFSTALSLLTFMSGLMILYGFNFIT